MTVYHLSATLRLGDALVPDHQRCAALARPFTQALERGGACFDSMVLMGKYLYAVLSRSGLREWSDYAKWAAEGAFEYVRARDFPQRPSRLGCNYFYSDLSSSRRLFQDDWGEASPEERAAVRLFEVELEDECPARLDMGLYDAAYAALSERQDGQAALELARRYFAGEAGGRPVWELLSARPARAVRDITAYLYET